MSSGYNWHDAVLAECPKKPKIDDLESGIGCMLGEVQMLICRILGVLYINRLMEHNQLDDAMQDVDDWLDGLSEETFYRLIKRYVRNGGLFDPDAAQREWRQMNDVRERRNYFVHQFHKDYIATDEQKKMEFLRKRFNELRSLIGEIRRISNRTDNILKKVEKGCRSKANVQRNRAEQMLRSEISEIIDRYGRGGWADVSLVRGRLDGEALALWDGMPGKSYEKLDNLGFVTGLKKGTAGAWMMSCRRV